MQSLVFPNKSKKQKYSRSEFFFFAFLSFFFTAALGVAGALNKRCFLVRLSMIIQSRGTTSESACRRHKIFTRDESRGTGASMLTTKFAVSIM
jgi:hypothetical protein